MVLVNLGLVLRFRSRAGRKKNSRRDGIGIGISLFDDIGIGVAALGMMYIHTI
jgi:hypothetical protein